MNYRQVADHVKQRQLQRHSAMSAPDDDWYPEAYFLRDGHLHRADIPVRWFENRATKDALVNRVLVPLIRAGGVRVFAMTVVMYALRLDHPVGQVIAERVEAGSDAPTAGLPRFQDVDGSIEQLWVHVLDAERTEGWIAEITRPEAGPPRLSPFSLPVGPDGFSGDLIDPIKEALR